MTELWFVGYKKPHSGRLVRYVCWGKDFASIKTMADARINQDHPGKGYLLYGIWRANEDQVA
jgi:hypothetical protein